jgi:excisionase family DNA binding protein
MPTGRGIKRGEKNNTTLRPMLTTGEACQVLSIHSNTLRRWSAQGIITAYRIGPRGDRRFRREDVDTLIAKAGSPKNKKVTRSSIVNKGAGVKSQWHLV